MKSQFVKEMLVNIPEEVKLFSKLYADLTLKINETLSENKISQKSLAERMQKKPSEISKWLNGGHNLTLKTICKLQAELGVTLLEVPKDNICLVTENNDFDKEVDASWDLSTTTRTQARIIPLFGKEDLHFSDDFKLVAYN